MSSRKIVDIATAKKGGKETNNIKQRLSEMMIIATCSILLTASLRCIPDASIDSQANPWGQETHLHGASHQLLRPLGAVKRREIEVRQLREFDLRIDSRQSQHLLTCLQFEWSCFCLNKCLWYCDCLCVSLAWFKGLDGLMSEKLYGKGR